MTDYSLLLDEDEKSLTLIFDTTDAEYFCDWLKQRTGAKRLEQAWQSKYNGYIQHDYKPFNVDGFDFIATLYYDRLDSAKFAEFVAEKELSKRIQLDNLLLI